MIQQNYESDTAPNYYFNIIFNTKFKNLKRWVFNLLIISFDNIADKLFKIYQKSMKKIIPSLIASLLFILILQKTLLISSNKVEGNSEAIEPIENQKTEVPDQEKQAYK